MADIDGHRTRRVRRRYLSRYGILAAMGNALAWVAAIGALAAAIGAWRTEATARWQSRAERLHTDAARRENELHRRRFAEVWNWQRNEPEDDARTQSARWYGEWTGNYRPRRGGLDDAALTPGLHSGSEDEAYRDYLGFLDAVYHPGQLGAPPRALGRSSTQ
jgi:hypothetical protein